MTRYAIRAVTLDGKRYNRGDIIPPISKLQDKKTAELASAEGSANVVKPKKLPKTFHVVKVVDGAAETVTTDAVTVVETDSITTPDKPSKPSKTTKPKRTYGRRKHSR